MAYSEIRKFRHEISILKHKGIITGVDARSVQPTPALRKKIARFDDVLSGKSTPVKLSKNETANMKAAGYDVFKGRVLFPHSAGEKVGVSHGHARVRQPNGVERVTIPVQYHKLDSYLRGIQKNEKAIDAMKQKNEFFAFRFYGHQSNAVYRTIDLLVDDLERYQRIEAARSPTSSAQEMNEIYRNLEVVKVHRSRDWGQQAERNRTERGVYNPAHYKRAKRARKINRFKSEAYLERQKVASQTYRDNLNAKDKAAYKVGSKKRAKKSRRKNANKKGKKK